MSNRDALQKTTKSLAQVLYEASPGVGWQGSWHRLGEAQQRWWQEFAEVAGNYLTRYGDTGAHLIGSTNYSNVPDDDRD